MGRVMVGMCVSMACMYRTFILPYDSNAVQCTVIRCSNTVRNNRLVQQPQQPGLASIIGHNADVCIRRPRCAKHAPIMVYRTSLK